MKPTIEERHKELKKRWAAFNQAASELMKALGTEAQTFGAVRPRVTVIQTAVAEFYQLPMIAMTTPARPRRYAHPRQTAMTLCREMTNLGLEEIGDCFGGRDHGTVIFAVQSVGEREEQEPDFRAEMETLRKLVRSRLDSIDIPLFNQPAPPQTTDQK